MLELGYNVRIGEYRLVALDSVKVMRSVERLSDTATIVLPGTYYNRALDIESKLKEGDVVEIEFGYNNDFKNEFKGYLNIISTDDGSIKLECEDALYLFRSNLEDRELVGVSLQTLLSEVVSEINIARNANYSIECDYDFVWDKFVIYRATGYDVLKKVQDETKANIYFINNVLYVHPQYSKIANTQEVVFDFGRNIEKSDLKYITAKQRKIEVEVTATMADGNEKRVVFGDTGGEKEVINAGTANEASMNRLAEERYKQLSFDGYEGSFTGWLLPYCEPGYKVKINDADYPSKTGVYYVIATDVEFSAKGGNRKITIGKKIN